MLGPRDTLVTDWRCGRWWWVLKLEIVASDRRDPQRIDWGGRISTMIVVSSSRPRIIADDHLVGMYPMIVMSLLSLIGSLSFSA